MQSGCKIEGKHRQMQCCTSQDTWIAYICHHFSQTGFKIVRQVLKNLINLKNERSFFLLKSNGLLIRNRSTKSLISKGHYLMFYILLSLVTSYLVNKFGTCPNTVLKLDKYDSAIKKTYILPLNR